MKKEGFNLDDYKELPYFELLKVAIKEKDLEKIKKLIAEYDEVLKRDFPGIIAENPGPGYQASPGDEPVIPTSERGIYFKTEHAVTLKHSQFKREMYIYQRMEEAVIEARSTTIRYGATDVINKMRAVVRGELDV